MFKKLTLALTLTIVLTSLGCVCQSGNRFGIGTYNPCGPCGASYECTPCGMSACDPVAPCEASCDACTPSYVAGPCEQVTCGSEPSACEPSACEPSACEPSACTACEPSACTNACSCNPCDCVKGLGVRTSLGLGIGSENGLFNSFRHGTIRQGHGAFNQVPEEMYVTRGPRDFFYSPNSSRR